MGVYIEHFNVFGGDQWIIFKKCRRGPLILTSRANGVPFFVDRWGYLDSAALNILAVTSTMGITCS